MDKCLGLCFQTINCSPASPRARHQDQDRCLGDPHCYPELIVLFWLFSNPRTRGALTTQRSWPLFWTDSRYYLELKLLSPVLIQSSIFRWTIQSSKDTGGCCDKAGVWAAAGVAVHIVFTTYEVHKSCVRSLHLNYNLRQWLPTLPRWGEKLEIPKKPEQASVKCEALHEEMVCGCAVGTFLVSPLHTRLH